MQTWEAAEVGELEVYWLQGREMHRDRTWGEDQPAAKLLERRSQPTAFGLGESPEVPEIGSLPMQAKAMVCDGPLSSCGRDRLQFLSDSVAFAMRLCSHWEASPSGSSSRPGPEQLRGFGKRASNWPHFHCRLRAITATLPLDDQSCLAVSSVSLVAASL